MDLDDAQPALVLTLLTRVKILGKVAGRNYRRSQLTRMAAALSFRTIFGLIPVLAVGLVVLHSFVSEAQLRGVVSNILEYTGLSRISVQASDSIDSDPGADQLSLFGPPSPVQIERAEREAVQREERRQEELQAWITRLLDRLDSINFGAVGIVGVLLLIYAAISLIVEIEKCFNQLADAPLGKNWVRRIRDYWALLTLGPLLLVLSFGVRQSADRIARDWTRAADVAREQRATQARAEEPAEHLAPEITEEAHAGNDASSGTGESTGTVAATLAADDGVRTGWRGFVVSLVGFTVTVCITTLALLIVYTAVPNARMQIMACMAGGVFAAVLWEASKWGLTAYISSSATYARLYGVLALIPLFLLWVYVTWLIVLLGFQVATILQTYRSVSREGFKQSVLIALGIERDPADAAKPRGLRIVDPAAALLVMTTITGKFLQGLPAKARDVADATGLESSVVSELLQRLVELRLIHRVAESGAGEDASESYSLARPPQSIAAGEVLLAGDSLTSRDRTKPAPILEAVTAAKLRALEGKTLADMHAMLSMSDLLPAPQATT